MTDALDTPVAELYGCVVFPYEGQFVGLVWVHHCDPDLDKYMGGTTDCQLAYSYNGWHMNRSIRKPFIPNTSPGELGGGTVQPLGNQTIVFDPARLAAVQPEIVIDAGNGANCLAAGAVHPILGNVVERSRHVLVSHE